MIGSSRRVAVAHTIVGEPARRERSPKDGDRRPTMTRNHVDRITAIVLAVLRAGIAMMMPAARRGRGSRWQRRRRRRERQRRHVRDRRRQRRQRGSRHHGRRHQLGAAGAAAGTTRHPQRPRSRVIGVVGTEYASGKRGSGPGEHAPVFVSLLRRSGPATANRKDARAVCPPGDRRREREPGSALRPSAVEPATSHSGGGSVSFRARGASVHGRGASVHGRGASVHGRGARLPFIAARSDLATTLPGPRPDR